MESPPNTEPRGFLWRENKGRGGVFKQQGTELGGGGVEEEAEKAGGRAGQSAKPSSPFSANDRKSKLGPSAQGPRTCVLNRTEQECRCIKELLGATGGCSLLACFYEAASLFLSRSVLRLKDLRPTSSNRTTEAVSSRRSGF